MIKMQAIIIGFMGSGKTTVGRELSESLNVNNHDLDEIIVNQIGESISSFFKTHSEAEFRKIERQQLQKAMNLEGILSTGGGTPMQNSQIFKATSIPVFLLDAVDETILKRLTKESGRPLVEKLGMDGILQLKAKRQPAYEAISDYIIHTDNKTPQAVSKEIINKLRSR